jgi:hypothetical protein
MLITERIELQPPDLLLSVQSEKARERILSEELSDKEALESDGSASSV